MQKLIIKQKGKVLQEVILQTETEYIIGRAKDNNIVLPEHPGISRKHLSLSFGENDQWTVKNLSQMSKLIIAGEEKEEDNIPTGGSFQIQSFEFILHKEEKEPEVSNQQPEPENTTHAKEPLPLYQSESLLAEATNTIAEKTAQMKIKRPVPPPPPLPPPFLFPFLQTGKPVSWIWGQTNNSYQLT